MKKLSALFLVLVLSLSTLFASEERPVVAVVLSGGGARGFEHIAVLETVEKYGIPVDMVLGTSMGAMIGGFYASGYSIENIKELVSEVDLGSVLKEKPIYPALTTMSAFDSVPSNLINMGLSDFGIGGAPGVIGDNRIMQLLSTAFYRVDDVENFDDLPVLFRCVGTNAETGDRIVFDGSNGNIVDAIRASISLPIVFPPYQIPDGRLVMDGGMVNNLPVYEALMLGADIVIGCNVNNRDVTSRENLTTLSGTVDQVISLMVSRNLAEQESLCDILLKPDSSGISTLDFAKYEEILDRGYAECEAHAEEFQALHDEFDRNGWLRDYGIERHEFYYQTKPVVIRDVEFRDVLNAGIVPDITMIFNQFRGRILNKDVLWDLNMSMNRFREHNRLASVYFTTEYVMEDDRYRYEDLVIEMKDYISPDSNITAGTTAKFAMGYDDGFDISFLGNIGLSTYLDAVIDRNTSLDIRMGLSRCFDFKADISGLIAQGETYSLSYTTGLDMKLGRLTPVNPESYLEISDGLDLSFGLDMGLDLKFLYSGLFSFSCQLEYLHLRNSFTGPGLSINNIIGGYLLSSVKWNTLVEGNIIREGFKVALDNAFSFYLTGMGYYNRFELVKGFRLDNRNHMQLDLQIVNSRLPYYKADSYIDINSPKGLYGYSSSKFRRDLFLMGASYQFRMIEKNVPIYLDLGIRCGFMEKRDNYDDIHIRPPQDDVSYFDIFDNFVMGFKAGCVIDASMGSVAVEFGVNLDGKFSFLIDFR